MPEYWEFRLFIALSILLALYLALRWYFLWRAERQARRQGFYGYPFLTKPRANLRVSRS